MDKMLSADVRFASMLLKSFSCDAMHKSSAYMKLCVSVCRADRWCRC